MRKDGEGENVERIQARMKDGKCKRWLISKEF